MRVGTIVMAAATASFVARAEAAPEADSAPARPATKIDPRAARTVMSRLPLAFETNHGQAPAEFDFLVRCRGYHAFVRSNGIVFSFDGAPLAMTLEGADKRPPSTDGLALPGRVNYLLGNDASNWITEIPVVRGARYDDVAPAASWSVGGRGRALEFAFDLAPGADAPRLRFDGARGVRLADDGSLRVAMPGGEATISAPVAWQDAGGLRVDARARFVVEKDGAVRVATAPRDPDRAVHVDPAVTYESYLGGGGVDSCNGAAIDSSGAAYFAGQTNSPQFPTTSGALRTTTSDVNGDAFVTKVNAAGSALVYSTYLGGTLGDYAQSLLVDAAGNAFVMGRTSSTDYPVTSGVVQPTKPGSGAQGCLSELNAAGSSLVFSTYMLHFAGSGMAFGPSGGIYTAEGIGPALYAAGGTSLVFYSPVAAVSQSANITFNAVASDADGNVYATGSTAFTPFPTTTGAYQTTRRGNIDAFVVKMDSSGATVYSTFLGGNATEEGFAIDVNLAGQAYVAGQTVSSDFPTTPGAISTTYVSSPAYNSFLTRLDAAGASLRYSTYLEQGVAYAIRVHPYSSCVVGGYTDSATFPASSAFQSSSGGSRDAFVLKLNRDNTVAWSSYWGGSGTDGVQAIGMAPDGSVALGGGTSSTDLPTVNPYQATKQASNDGSILCIHDSLPATAVRIAVTTIAAPTWTVGFPYAPFQLTAVGGVGPYTWSLVSGSLPATMTFGSDGVITGTPPQVGPYSFTVRVDDPTEMTATRQILLQVNPYPSIATSSLPAATLDTPYDKAVPSVDGSGTLTFSVAAGATPPGLTLGANGRLTGTPTQIGDFSFTAGVEDGRGATGSGLVAIHVNPFPSVTATSTPDWTETRAYTVQFAATGGTPPLVWSLAAGALPTTTSLNSATGKISGPAKAAGPYAFTLRATDANGAQSERVFAVAINAFPVVAGAVPPRLAVGRPCSVKPVLAGGTAPFQWTRTVGHLPAGLAVDPATGEIAGVPTEASSSEVQIECVDAAGAASAGHVLLTTALPVDLARKRAAETVVLTLQSPPSVERYLELTANALLGVAVAGGGSAAGGPRLRLYDASGAELDLAASTRSTPKSVTLKKFVVPSTGRYFLAVLPALGSVGKMRVTTTVAPAARWTSSGAVGPTASPEYSFTAPPGSFLTIVAKSAKLSPALPRIVRVTAPDGTDLAPDGRVVEKGKAAMFSLKTPLAGGEYRVVFGPRDANAGDVSWTVKLRMPARYLFAMPDVVAGE